jgi:hypothetical protein
MGIADIKHSGMAALAPCNHFGPITHNYNLCLLLRPRISKHLSLTFNMIQQELYYAVAYCPT